MMSLRTREKARASQESPHLVAELGVTDASEGL